MTFSTNTPKGQKLLCSRTKTNHVNKKLYAHPPHSPLDLKKLDMRNRSSGDVCQQKMEMKRRQSFPLFVVIDSWRGSPLEIHRAHVDHPSWSSTRKSYTSLGFRTFSLPHQTENFLGNQSIGKQIHHLEDFLNAPQQSTCMHTQSTLQDVSAFRLFSSVDGWKGAANVWKFGNKWNENGTQRIKLAERGGSRLESKSTPPRKLE